MKFVLPLLSPCMSSLDVASLNLRWKDKQIRFLEPLTCPTDFDPAPDFPGLCSWYCDQMQAAIDQCFPLSNRAARFSVLVDRVDLHRQKLWLLAEKPCWEQLIAVLIMVFPDVAFYFATPYFEQQDEETKALSRIVGAHGTKSLLAGDWDIGLFDQSGLRDFLRNRKVDPEDHRFQFPSRRHVAAAIDDELDYALFNALAAYRFGYRAAVINTYKELEKRFGTPSDTEAPCGFGLLFEDMSLNFFDKPRDTHLILLEDRAQTFKGLREDINRKHKVGRVLVTTGQGSSEALDKNKEYLKIDDSGRSSPTTADAGLGLIRSLVLKPSGGFIDLWVTAGLHSSGNNGQRPGNAPGFIWPPLGSNNGEQQPSKEPHGLLGGLALTNELILRRAKHLQRSTSSIYDLSVICVLAIDAVEMVSGKSMHLGIESLLLKHEVEVEIESRFNGIGYHVDAQKRLEEIALECSNLSKRINDKSPERFNLDAQLAVLTRLSRIYYGSGLLEEYELCVRRIRLLNRDLVGLKRCGSASASKPWLEILKKVWPRYQSSENQTVGYCKGALSSIKAAISRNSFGQLMLTSIQFLENQALRYSEEALSSIKAVILRTLLAQWILTIMWGAITCSWGSYSGVMKTISTVANTFWTQNVVADSPAEMLFLHFVAVISLLHIGLMVACLYSLVSRR